MPLLSLPSTVAKMDGRATLGIIREPVGVEEAVSISNSPSFGKADQVVDGRALNFCLAGLSPVMSGSLLMPWRCRHR